MMMQPNRRDFLRNTGLGAGASEDPGRGRARRHRRTAAVKPSGHSRARAGGRARTPRYRPGPRPRRAQEYDIVPDTFVNMTALQRLVCTVHPPHCVHCAPRHRVHYAPLRLDLSNNQLSHLIVCTIHPLIP